MNAKAITESKIVSEKQQAFIDGEAHEIRAGETILQFANVYTCFI